MQDGSGEKSKIAGRAWNIHRAGQRKRFTRVDRFRACQLLKVALDQIGNAQENARAVGRWYARPFRERFLRRGDSEIDIPIITVRDLAVRFSRRGLDIVEIFSSNRLNELTVDEVGNLEWFGAHC